MIVGNPKAPSIMRDALNAYCKHGPSIQGMLPAFRASYPHETIRDWFWIMSLRDWAHVEYGLACRIVGDLARATMTPLAWRIQENAEAAVRKHFAEKADA